VRIKFMQSPICSTFQHPRSM